MYRYLSSFLVAALAILLASAPSRAQDLEVRSTPDNAPGYTKSEKDYARSDPGYFTINPDSVKVTLLSVKDEQGPDYVQLQEQPPKDVANILVSVDQIVNIASKVWEIVKDNKPVVAISTKYAAAYPYGVTAANQLASWSRPKSYEYGFYAENLYGAVMIDCKYKFSFSYNGAYKGIGKFLTGVAVIPSNVTAGWGYKFYMNAEVPDSTIVNVGTDANPVAAMQMKLSWKMSTVLKEVTGTSVYYVDGSGYFEEIASPWKNRPAKKLADFEASAPLLDPARVF